MWKKIIASVSIFVFLFITAWVAHGQLDPYPNIRYPETGSDDNLDELDPSGIRPFKTDDSKWEQRIDPFRPREYLRIRERQAPGS